MANRSVPKTTSPLSEANHTRPARTFPEQWSALPAHIKDLHARAEKAGLVVIHSSAKGLEDVNEVKQWCNRWIWAGSEAAFRASGLVDNLKSWEFEGKAVAVTSDGIELELRRSDDAILAIHRSYVPPTSAGVKRLAACAMTDPAFQAFRAAALQPIPGLTADDAEEDAQ